jgi:hypothetical protein
MIFTESNTVEQMLLYATVKLGGKQVSMLHWNTSLSGLACAADFCPSACYTYLQHSGNSSHPNTVRSASPHEAYVAGAGDRKYTLRNIRHFLLFQVTQGP